MKKCPFCNADVNDDAVFCPECGASMNTSSEGTGLESSQPPIAGMGEPPKNKKGKFVIAGVVAAGVVAAAVFAGVKLMAKDPKDVVIDAFKGVYSADNVSPSEEVFGWNGIAEKSLKENMEGGFSLALDQGYDQIVNMFAGTEITSTSKSDVAGKKAYGEMGIRIANMDLMSFELYADQEKIAVAIPELSDKVFSLDYANDLEGQIAASPVAGQIFGESGIEPSVIQDYMDYLWSFYDEEGERPFDVQALWNRYKEGSQAINDFKEAMTVEKTDGAEFTVDGKTVECKGYDVTISQQAMIDFVETTSQFFMEDETLKNDVLEYLSQIIALSGGSGLNGLSADDVQEEAWTNVEDFVDTLITAMEESMDDINMTVYVDKKGRLAAFEGNTSLDVEGSFYDITVKAELQGGSYPTQNAQLVMEIEEDGELVTVTVEKEGEYDDAFLTSNVDVTAEGSGEKLTFSYAAEYDRASGDYTLDLSAGDGEQTGSLNINGTVSNLKPGESFDISMDTIGVNWNGEEILTLSGSYSLKPLEGEVSMPEGEEMDVMAATYEEWYEVGEEMSGNVEDIAATFQDLLSNVLMFVYLQGSQW